jgi:hypothetical protein
MAWATSGDGDVNNRDDGDCRVGEEDKVER